MEHDMIRKLSFEDLLQFTDGFSDENYIGKFQFGKVYRGKIKLGTTWTKDVTVKIWEDSKIYRCYDQDNENRLRDEVFLLQHERLSSHPNLVKLMGYCCEAGQQLGVVYDLKPLDTVHNLLLNGSFTWSQRIKVAVEFARLVEYLHTGGPRYFPFLLRNIDASHIMLDLDYTPKLYDFSMVCGGVLPDWSDLKNQYVFGSYGYIDPYTARKGEWSEERDVFAFGVVLLCLIAKRNYTEEDRLSRAPFVYDWARNEYKPKKSIFSIDRSKCSLVHESLKADSFFELSDGQKITSLAMQCVKYYPCQRPLMKEVVKDLLNLHVVRHYAETLRINKNIRDHSALPKKFTAAVALCCLLSKYEDVKRRLLDLYYSHKAIDVVRLQQLRNSNLTE